MSIMGLLSGNVNNIGLLRGNNTLSSVINRAVSFAVMDSTKKPLQATVKVTKGFGLLNNYGIRQSIMFEAWDVNDKGDFQPHVVNLPIGYYNYEITVDGYDGTITGRFLLKDNMNIPIIVRTR